MMRAFYLIFVVFFYSTADGQIKPLPDKLLNFDPSGLVRFGDTKTAEARRTQLIHYVWQNGLPKKALPKSRLLTKDVFSQQLSGIDPENAKQVLELRCEIEPYDFVGLCYWVQSSLKNDNNRRLVIVHSGHRRGTVIGEGVDQTVEQALKRGFQVLVVDMPLVGWNKDRTVTIPPKQTTPKKEILIGNRGTGSHNDMFRQLGDPILPKGTVFRFFVEPVVQGINFFCANTENPKDVTMVGLSGGGWATHFCAAIDTRIRYSFPVAGAMPLYARKFSPGSWGDSEQYYEPVYGEKDTNGDGVGDTATGEASWLEIFALGGIGKSLIGTGKQNEANEKSESAGDRRQLQILNINDPCCFSTVVYKTYDSFLKRKVKKLGGGWELFSDRTHRKHIISTKAIEVIFATLD